MRTQTATPQYLLAEIERDLDEYHQTDDRNARDTIYQRFNAMCLRLQEILFSETQLEEMKQGLRSLIAQAIQDPTVSSIIEVMIMSLTCDDPTEKKDESAVAMPALESAPLESVKAKILSLSESRRCGNKFSRFMRLLAEAFKKPEVTVDGFVWAIERALFNPAGDFDEFDRMNIRNDVPQFVDAIFSGQLATDIKVELARIKQGTHNLG